MDIHIRCAKCEKSLIVGVQPYFFEDCKTGLTIGFSSKISFVPFPTNGLPKDKDQIFDFAVSISNTEERLCIFAWILDNFNVPGGETIIEMLDAWKSKKQIPPEYFSTIDTSDAIERIKGAFRNKVEIDPVSLKITIYSLIDPKLIIDSQSDLMMYIPDFDKDSFLKNVNIRTKLKIHVHSPKEVFTLPDFKRRGKQEGVYVVREIIGKDVRSAIFDKRKEITRMYQSVRTDMSNVDYISSETGTSLIHRAVMSMKRDGLEFSIENNANIDTMTILGDTALTLAAKIENKKAIKFLLEYANRTNGNKIFTPSQHGMTFLMAAVATVNQCFIRSLLRNEIVSSNITHLMHSRAYLHIPLHFLMVQLKEADVYIMSRLFGDISFNVPDVKYGYSVFHYMAMYDSPMYVISYVVERLESEEPGSLNRMLAYKSVLGNTALHVAARYNSKNMIKWIVAQMPELKNEPNNEQARPVDIAVWREDTDLAKYLSVDGTIPMETEEQESTDRRRNALSSRSLEKNIRKYDTDDVFSTHYSQFGNVVYRYDGSLYNNWMFIYPKIQGSDYTVPSFPGTDLSQVDDDSFKKNRITLFLDLDETMLHFYIKRSQEPVVLPEGVPRDTRGFGYMVRPHAVSFLEFASKYYNLVIFTAGDNSHANECLHILDPFRKYFSRVFWRDYCSFANRADPEDRVYFKNLAIFNLQMTRIAIIDDSSANFSAEYKNGIPIKKFSAFLHGGQLNPSAVYDDELLRLIPFLDHMKDVTDTTEFVNNRVMF